MAAIIRHQTDDIAGIGSNLRFKQGDMKHRSNRDLRGKMPFYPKGKALERGNCHCMLTCHDSLQGANTRAGEGNAGQSRGSGETTSLANSP
ncbi:hypothetical protein GCM10027295_32580 [Pseudaeromonas pectinilytica]